MQFFEEELLEPVARYFRFKKGIPHIPTEREIVMADLGCGPKLRFYHYARNKGVRISRYYGIDPLLDKDMVKQYRKSKDVVLVDQPLKSQTHIPAHSVDVVVAFAFIEHIDNPDEIISESVRLVKKGGKVVITTPALAAQQVLEFLSFRLNLISKREIEEHKIYFDKSMLLGYCKDLPVSAHHEYFEFGLNNLLVLTID